MLPLFVCEGTGSRKIRKSQSKQTRYSRNTGVHETFSNSVSLSLVFDEFSKSSPVCALYYIIFFQELEPSWDPASHFSDFCLFVSLFRAEADLRKRPII